MLATTNRPRPVVISGALLNRIRFACTNGTNHAGWCGLYMTPCVGTFLKNGASLEDASTVEREWLYVTPHSHSPTHYRDVSLFVFPIREKYLYSYTTARAVHRCKFLLLKDLL